MNGLYGVYCRAKINSVLENSFFVFFIDAVRVIVVYVAISCVLLQQNVCGFDLLRANGKSYVCDVNGFSFVKTSPKYYDDCAKILGSVFYHLDNNANLR